MRYFRWCFVVLLLGLASLPARADFQVFACEPEWASLVREFLPEAKITTATSYLQDPHYIEARPSLIAAMRRADIAVCTGASLEAGWLPTLLQRASNSAIQPGRAGLFYAAEHAQLHAPHDHVDRSMGDVHPEGNPHVHLSPDEVPAIAKALAQRLGQLIPEASGDILARYIRWRGDWSKHRIEWRQKAEVLQGRSVAIQHTNFSYLLNWLGVDSRFELEPKPGLPPSASHLSQLLAEPELKDVEAILIASHQDPQPANWLASQIQKPVLVVPGTVNDAGETQTLAELISMIVNTLEATVQEDSGGRL
ncbi:metal ABC transporter solute-binding protein, Zn/Mn family [Marinobacter sp.]|uniref:metal ABC transporter solute-binding protein, Zn/Mn family n=1 Tax=Marinobacter sp. TaxID=50741 RepID=UPI003A8D3631